MIDQIIKDFPVTISPMISIGQIEVIIRELAKTLDLPGAVVELGCNVGTTSLYIRRVLDAYDADKDFHVYDSFEGLPEPHELDGETKRLKGNMRKSVTDIEKSFLTAGLQCPIIHKGWFSQIPDYEYPDRICFAFFDGDFYTSIMDSFNKVYHKMVINGIIVIHDYSGASLPGVQAACEEFLQDKPEGIIHNTGMAIVVKA